MALKAEFKAATGKDWKPEAAPVKTSAPAKAAAPVKASVAAAPAAPSLTGKAAEIDVKIK